MSPLTARADPLSTTCLMYCIVSQGQYMRLEVLSCKVKGSSQPAAAWKIDQHMHLWAL